MSECQRSSPQDRRAADQTLAPTICHDQTLVTQIWVWDVEHSNSSPPKLRAGVPGWQPRHGGYGAEPAVRRSSMYMVSALRRDDPAIKKCDQRRGGTTPGGRGFEYLLLRAGAGSVQCVHGGHALRLSAVEQLIRAWKCWDAARKGFQKTKKSATSPAAPCAHQRLAGPGQDHRPSKHTIVRRRSTRRRNPLRPACVNRLRRRRPSVDPAGSECRWATLSKDQGPRLRGPFGGVRRWCGRRPGGHHQLYTIKQATGRMQNVKPGMPARVAYAEEVPDRQAGADWNQVQTCWREEERFEDWAAGAQCERNSLSEGAQGKAYMA